MHLREHPEVTERPSAPREARCGTAPFSDAYVDLFSLHALGVSLNTTRHAGYAVDNVVTGPLWVRGRGNQSAPV